MGTERFEASLAFVLKWEGSRFTNDPDDHGGATRFGIIQREYDAFRRRLGLQVRSVESIAMDEVRAIYRRRYWEAVQGDDLGVPLDIAAFDTAVLMGVGRSIRFIQQSLDVGVDGAIGPETLGALADADGADVAASLMDLRETRLRAIVAADSTQGKFLRGWLNRLNDLRRTVARSGQLERADALEEELLPEEDVAMGRASLDVAEDFLAPEEGVPAGTGDDPAAPGPGDLAGEAAEDFAAARELANFGAGEWEADPSAVEEERSVLEGAAAAVTAAPIIALDINLVRAFLEACTSAVPRVVYGLGAKVPFHGAVPGRDFKAVDCSGFVREAIWRATSPHQSFPDGSVVQHDWIRDRNFQRSTPDAALQQDGIIRIAFLRPQDSPKHIGHVVLIHNARTFESHGGVGPDSRAWTKADWQGKTSVYVLAP
jgi:lysozyme family protein